MLRTVQSIFDRPKQIKPSFGLRTLGRPLSSFMTTIDTFEAKLKVDSAGNDRMISAQRCQICARGPARSSAWLLKVDESCSHRRFAFQAQPLNARVYGLSFAI
jgi:hypothetical protein